MLVRCENTKQILTEAITRFFESGSAVELPEAFDSSDTNVSEDSLMAQKLTRLFFTGPFDKEVKTLSIREREVLEFLSRGLLIKEIASQMEISFDTVRTYIRRIYQKLHVHSRTQVVAKYFRIGNVIKK